MNGGSALGVLIDGVPLPSEEARALWLRFSEHMDAHKGDMDGFAKLNGYVSVRPAVQGGKAVLVVKTKAAPSEPAKDAKAAPKKSAPSKKARRSR